MTQKITGVQRYAYEIINRWDDDYKIESCNSSNPLVKHLWMQTRLKKRIPDAGGILWSPTNIGPLNVKNQILTLHDIADFLYPDWFSGYYSKLRHFLIPKLVKRIAGIITVSEFSKKNIVEQFDLIPSKVKVIHNGVNKDHFFEASRDQMQEVRAKFRIDGKYILTLGSLDPRKNLKGIFEAWSLLKKEQPAFDYDLVIVGGQGKNFSQNYLTEDFKGESVKYLGYVEDKYLAPLYSSAAVFVYPSLFEGFGLPVLEAMSCGTPVVTSNTGALKEICEGAAELIDPKHPEEIAQGILNVACSEQLAKKIIAQGKKRVERFRWKKAAQETYDFLKEFI